MGEMNHNILIGATVIVGLLATVVYYFARYAFRSHDKDSEVLPSIKSKSESLKSTDQLVEKIKHEDSEPEKVKVQSAEVKEPQKIIEKVDLKDALANTKANFFGRIKQSLVGKQTLSEDDIELLEEVLYTSDLGPVTVQRLMTAVGSKLSLIHI